MGLFIDIAQTFDSISHPLLLKKINDRGLVGNLPCFIRDFISGRRLSVRYANVLSSPYSVTHGVPQDSVISPTLFLIKIDDICPIFALCRLLCTLGQWAQFTGVHNNHKIGLDSIVIWSNMWSFI